MTTVTLSEMITGGKGVVADVNGGHRLARRLDALGIRPGAMIEKLTGAPMRGPVTVRVGTSRVALGYGMAGNVHVEIKSEAAQ